jgi:hypothetical protein
MFVTRKYLDRRTLLKGLGASIALPFLDAMRPAFAAPTPAGPARLAFVYVPNGIVMKDWTPDQTGAAFDLPRILKPLEPHRPNLLVLSGLDHHNANALNDGPGDHARAGACFLTGVHPRKTAGKDISVGISADQIAAAEIGGATRFPSLELGTEDGRTAGDCDSGYSCAYTNSLAWRAEASPLPPVANPRLVFERLFGSDNAPPDPAVRARRAAWRKSILDMVQEDTERLSGGLGPSDRRKLDEYLFAVREIEQRIEAAEKQAAAHPFTPDIERPTGIPFYFADHLKLMYDLQVAAFQGDLTRVTTLMAGREGSTRTYTEIGIPDQHHPLTHHRGNPEMIDKVTRINLFHVEQFAYFLQKLAATSDGDATLLDRVMVVYGSAIADGNAHSHVNLPVLLAGRGGGLEPGRHVRYARGTPMTNLYMTLLDRMGVHPEKIGDSTGKIEHLTDL